MRLSHEEMLATLGTRNPANNGKFIIGVLSTGIYCLPSCHARTPKPENVRFFRNGLEATAAGLRPCKKCRPDEWERGEDSQLDRLERLVRFARAKPDKLRTVSDLATTFGVGTTKLSDLIRDHFQTTPAEILIQAKLERATACLTSDRSSIAEVALDSGFESLSVFNDNFKRRYGLTPTAYRQLKDCATFQFVLPASFCTRTFASVFGRDPASPSERLDGNRGVLASPGGSLVRFRIEEGVTVECEPGQGVDAFNTIRRAMGLSLDTGSFEHLASEKGFERLVSGRPGARFTQTYSVWDAVLWAVIGQQINLSFAFKIRRRLFEEFGTPVGEGLYAAPTPEVVAGLSHADLLGIQFSRQKADYLIGLAQMGSAWFTALEGMSFTRARKTLMNMRGFGIWSTQYVLMRGLGFVDCVPTGDTGLAAGLMKLYGLDQKPHKAQIDSLMQPFAPYRSLATFHLWQSLK
jgi:AraC family transcriptional regulator, regulatory protein of adaptative response / DNA-3-methyladenine glycosylase II